MSSIKIILSNSLNHKEISNFSTRSNNLELNLSNPELYYGEFEKTDKLLGGTGKYVTSNNFVNGFLHAYNAHKYIRIRPDDIKLQFLTVISTFVNNNAEIMRDFFVEHTGKKELAVESKDFSAEYFCNKFSELIEQNIKCPEFAQHIKSKFSTTNRIIQTVNNITLMNTLKEYFSYSMILSCGIPGVILDGTQEDWDQLKIMYEYFKSITQNSELKDWYTHFDMIFNMFIELRQLQNSGTVEEENVPTKFKELFKRVITYIPMGSGGDKILGGWIRLFCPYSNTNKLIGGLENKIPCLDITTEPPKITNCNNIYMWQDMMNAYYIGCCWNEISTSIMTTPAKLFDQNEKEYEVEFYSGFFEPHLNESDEIMLNIGYILRENTEIKKTKLTEQGVEHDELFNHLLIPSKLKAHATSIMKIFNSNSYSIK